MKEKIIEFIGSSLFWVIVLAWNAIYSAGNAFHAEDRMMMYAFVFLAVLSLFLCGINLLLWRTE